jgi:PTH1 family peptidyl-tRNA hydrolase
MSPTRIIIGLGNPGAQYALTRHNVGFWTVDALAQRHGIELRTRRYHSRVGVGTIAGVAVALAQPQTYMNLSGQAAQALLHAYRLTPDQMLVVFDDIWLAPGTVRVRPKGSAGGHNGMKSIIAALGTEAFPRVRIGIGQPPEGVDLADYVLSAPSAMSVNCCKTPCNAPPTPAKRGSRNPSSRSWRDSTPTRLKSEIHIRVQRARAVAELAILRV